MPVTKIGNPQRKSKDFYPLLPIPIDRLLLLWYTLMLVVVESVIIEGKMYKKVLLTDKEIALLKRVIGDHLHEKICPEAKNLQHIYSRLRDIKPTEKYVQSIN